MSSARRRPRHTASSGGPTRNTRARTRNRALREAAAPYRAPSTGQASCIDLTCDDDDEIVDLTTDSPQPVVLGERNGNIGAARDDSLIVIRDDSPIPSESSSSLTESSQASSISSVAESLNLSQASSISSPAEPSILCLSSPTTSSTVPSTPSTAPQASLVSNNSPAADSNELICPVCMDTISQMKKADKHVSSTVCGHIFCNQCIEQSVKIHKCCPTCRKKLGPRQFHQIFL